MTLKSLLKQSKHDAFRRIYIKRRDFGGEFEASWYQIPDSDIIKFGTYETGSDDILLNFYTTEGLSFELSNLRGLYSDVNENKSIFYNNISINGAMVKVEAGYKDQTGTEFPTNSTLFTGVISNDSSYNDDFKAKFSCKQLSYIFESFAAEQIPGLGTSQTASQIIEKIRDFQDGNSVYYFRKYFTSASWFIDTTTTQYNISTSTTLNNTTVWALMQKLAVAENYLLYVSNDQTVNFVNKANISTTSDFHFSGVGDSYPTFGFNIFGNMTVENNYRKVYNRINIEYGSSDAQYIKRETFNWGDSSSSFLYGVKEYKYKNEFIQSTTVSTIADNIYNEYVRPKQELNFTSKFIPQLEIGDLVSLTYQPFVPKTGAKWDNFLWNEVSTTGIFTPALWASRDGYNISIDNEDYKVIRILYDFDNFLTGFTLREI